MKFLCDIALPNSVEVFSQYGEVALKNGRQINADDLVDVDVLIIRSITKVNEDLLSKANKLKFVVLIVVSNLKNLYKSFPSRSLACSGVRIIVK